MEEQGDVSRGLPSLSRSDSKFVGDKRSSDDFEDIRGFCPKIQRLDPDPYSETTTLGTAHDSASNDREKQFLIGGGHDKCRKAKKGIGLDLNADAISSSASDELSACSSRIHGNTKSRDVFSECGSSNVSAKVKDPMKLWKAMKQNGFLTNPYGGISAASSCFVSSSHGGIPAPRRRGRESKNEAMMKRRIEIARKEEVDRFAKLAAPTGLLNELNPGIINHVRNKRQVLSIIENLVKSNKDSGNFLRASNRRSCMAVMGSKKNLEDVNADGLRSDSNQTDKWFMPLDKYPTRNYEKKCRDGDLSMADTIIGVDNTLGSKIQTAANIPENVSSLSSEEWADFSCASVLTVKAATVASQWLELLHQDIKGRLLALRRSRKRVRAVISTELPFLILKEFPFNQENDPNLLDGVSSTSRADIHKTRWTALFNQMELALSEEERHLESWLIQVRELQSHCDHGLQHLSMSSGQNFLQPGMPLDARSAETLSSEKELAVRAAAASIYSTCSFLTSMENITCA